MDTGKTIALIKAFGGSGGGGGSDLPAVTSEDNGDVLTVVNGAWDKAAPSGGSSLPSTPSTDGTYNLQNTVSSGSGTLVWSDVPYKVKIALELITEDDVTVLSSYTVLGGDYASAKAILDAGGLLDVYVSAHEVNIGADFEATTAGASLVWTEPDSDAPIDFFATTNYLEFVWDASGIVLA